MVIFDVLIAIAWALNHKPAKTSPVNVCESRLQSVFDSKSPRLKWRAATVACDIGFDLVVGLWWV
jgi:hypothetical protein